MFFVVYTVDGYMQQNVVHKRRNDALHIVLKMYLFVFQIKLKFIFM